MATYVPAKRNTAFIFYLPLVSTANRPDFQSNPTLAAGDVKVSKDGGALANITSLPTVSPASSVQVKVSLSATEMDADVTTVIFIDAAGNEWDDVLVEIPTAAQQIDDLANPGDEMALINDAITSAKIAANAIGASEIADDAITAAKIATGAIDADAIADNAIDAGAIANDAITAAKIATGAIDADAIADNAIDAGAIAADAITAAKIATGAIDADAIAADAITAAKIANAAIDAATFATDTDTYQAKVWLTDDDTGTADRYTVVWYKNGQPIVSGITSPTIQVYKIADGSDLVASTAMTEIASTGTYRYVEASNRIVDGVGYIILVSATIGGSGRTWYQPVSRDS